jgi:type II secretory pathway pseudopilin PulG
MNILKQTKGYSLVEALVAISILLIALVGPMTIAAKGIQSANYVREQTIAISLAQEGIEAFIAARNDATIEALNSGNLSASWDWVSDSRINDCRGANGCNIEYSDNEPLDSVAGCTGAGGSGCELFFNSGGGRARYVLSSSGAVPTPYRRVIKVSDIGVTGLHIESTVYWGAQLFGGQSQSLTLISEVYKLYD